MNQIEHQQYQDNVLTDSWNDQTRIYTDYRTDPPTTRDYTPEENLRADEEAAQQTRIANETTLRSGLSEELDKALARQAELTTVIDTTNSTINSNPANYIKTVARQQRRSENALMRLIRLVGDLTDSADLGSDN